MEQTLLAFVDDLHENLQLWHPGIRHEADDFGMRLAGPDLGTCKGNHGYPTTVDSRIADVRLAGLRIS